MTTAHTKTSEASQQLDRDIYHGDATAANAQMVCEMNTIYSGLSGRFKLLSSDVEQGRRTIRTLDLDDRTSRKAMRNHDDLIEELAVERGLGWVDIAKLCKVSVSAVRKWRKGGAIASQSLRTLARLSAFLDMLEETAPMNNPAGWLMMPLTEQNRISGADLLRDGHAEDLIEFAQGHLSKDELLDRWNPDWRDKYVSEWMVVDRPDGERILTRRP